jgi:hypothetical protein
LTHLPCPPGHRHRARKKNAVYGQKKVRWWAHSVNNCHKILRFVEHLLMIVKKLQNLRRPSILEDAFART